MAAVDRGDVVETEGKAALPPTGRRGNLGIQASQGIRGIRGVRVLPC